MAWDLEWHQYIRKDGKPGRWYQVPGPEYTPLNKCDVCGLVSTPKKVQTRNDVYGWNRESRKDYLAPPRNMLCMGCWNRVRALVRRKDETSEIGIAIRKLQRAIQHERKNQNHR